MTEIQTALSASAVKPAVANNGRLRARAMVRINAITAVAMTHSSGVATRTSATRRLPSQRTVPFITSTETPATTAATFASAGDTYDAATAKTAAGISTPVSGTTTRFAGKPTTVARWK